MRHSLNNGSSAAPLARNPGRRLLPFCIPYLFLRGFRRPKGFPTFWPAGSFSNSCHWDHTFSGKLTAQILADCNLTLYNHIFAKHLHLVAVYYWRQGYNELQKHLVFSQPPSSSSEKLWSMKAHTLVSGFHSERAAKLCTQGRSIIVTVHVSYYPY